MKRSRPGYSRAAARPYRAPRKRRRITNRRQMVLYKTPAEVKGCDVLLEPIAWIDSSNTNSSALCVNLITPGTGSWNRVGRKIRLKSLRIKGGINCLLNEQTGLLHAVTGRMVVVWDKQPSNGPVPNYNEIFGTTTQNGVESCSTLDPLRYDNMNRFSVIRSKTFVFNPNYLYQTGGTPDTVWSKSVDMFIDLKNKETVFSGQSSPCTIADISTGALYVYFRATNYQSGEVTIYSGSTLHCRLRYTDS